MIRWRFLLPRVGVLLVLILLAGLCASQMLRSMIESSAERVVGAKVEFGGFKASLWKGTVRMTDIQIADPDHPLQNLMQADRGEFELNFGELLHRRWIVDKTRLSRVQFGTPRTDAGDMSDSANKSTNQHGVTVEPVPMPEHLGQIWSDQIKSSLPSFSQSKLESTRLAQQIKQKWPARFARYQTRLEDLTSLAVDLQTEVAKKADNPLRDLADFQRAVDRCQAVLDQVQALRAEIQQLRSEFQSDRDSVQEAGLRDQSILQQTVRVPQVNGEQISKLLLADRHAQLTKETVGWLQWIRDALPDPEDDFDNSTQTGFNLRFVDQPNFLFRDIELDGEGRIAGNWVNFVGRASNLTTTPKLIADPATFQLNSSGHHRVSVFATIDRRGPRDVDTFRVEAPAMEFGSQELGRNDALVVNVESGTCDVKVAARLIDNQLKGLIELEHHVGLSLGQFDSMKDGVVARTALDQKLRSIDRFTLTMTLSGTLQKPKASFDSDLGDEIASALDEAFNLNVQQSVAEKSSRLEAILIKQNREIDWIFEDGHQKLLALATQKLATVAELQAMASEQADSRKFR